MGPTSRICYAAFSIAVLAITNESSASDITVDVESLDAPYQVAVNSPANPTPYQIQLSSSSAEAEFALFVCAPGQRPTHNCVIETDFQASGTFEVSIFDQGIYTVVGWARHVGCTKITEALQPIYFFESSEVTPPNAAL